MREAGHKTEQHKKATHKEKKPFVHWRDSRMNLFELTEGPRVYQLEVVEGRDALVRSKMPVCGLISNWMGRGHIEVRKSLLLFHPVRIPCKMEDTVPCKSGTPPAIGMGMHLMQGWGPTERV